MRKRKLISFQLHLERFDLLCFKICYVKSLAWHSESREVLTITIFKIDKFVIKCSFEKEIKFKIVSRYWYRAPVYVYLLFEW